MNSNSDILSIAVAPGEEGIRLDKFLAGRIPGLSRSRIKQLIEDGSLARPDGAHLRDPAYKIKTDDHFDLTLPPAIDPIPLGENIPLTVVYEDDDLIVIDKPVGLVVHPGPGNMTGTLVNALIHHCGDSLSGIGGVKRPGIVHRLDKDTSGLMMAAKNDAAHHALSEQFAEHSIERVYAAIARNAPTPFSGRIEGNIGRSPQNRKKMAILKDRGKHAVTYYKTLERFGDGISPVASLIECRLETGRTHQVRLHMSSIGHPLIGDPTYGRPQKINDKIPSHIRDMIRRFPRQALHAKKLGFIHPRTTEPFTFSSAFPNDMETLLKALREYSA